MLVQSLLAFLLVVITTRASLTVHTRPGNVNGIRCPSSKASSFLGIPYAQPPTGKLRFASPVPYGASYAGGSLNATKLASTCIQFDTLFGAPGPYSEDCLYLNVWAPVNATSRSNLPVKTWIHGGGFRAGGTSVPLYNGCNLATDAVVVTIAYRLGPLGFLNIESAGIPGNMGLQDLMLGLQWIQDNVSAFGGDPRKVLVFGESAGAELAWILSTLSDAPSKMKAVISESGAGTILASNIQFQKMGQKYADLLGCQTTDIACFQAKSWEDLRRVNPSSYIRSWSPFVDGRVIPKQPSTLPSKVPFLAGTNTMEGTLEILSAFNSPRNVTIDDFYGAYQDFENGAFSVQIYNRYHPARYNSTGYGPFYALARIQTDYGYKCPTLRALKITSIGNIPAFTYLNSHVPTCPWEQNVPPQALQVLGATHSSEIPFVFRQLTGLPLANGTCALDNREKSISNALTAAWTSMADRGFPGSVGTGRGLWPTFNISTLQGLLITNNTAAGTIDNTNCDLWDEVARVQLLKQLANATSTSTKDSTSSQLANTTSTYTNGNASPPVSSNPTSSAGRGSSTMILFQCACSAMVATIAFVMG